MIHMYIFYLIIIYNIHGNVIWFSDKTRSGRNNVMTQDCLQIILCNWPRQNIMRLLMGIIFLTLIHLGSFKAIEDTQDSWTRHLRWFGFVLFRLRNNYAISQKKKWPWSIQNCKIPVRIKKKKIKKKIHSKKNTDNGIQWRSSFRICNVQN